jgi:hypothetical protein
LNIHCYLLIFNKQLTILNVQFLKEQEFITLPDTCA